MGINYNDVFKNIKTLCVKTLMAVEPEINTQMRVTKHKGQCFEIYGFDVLIDADIRPWLLEVNVAPSLSSSSPYDKKVKTTLLSDSMHLMGFNIFDRKRLEEERRDKKKGIVGIPPPMKDLKKKGGVDYSNDEESPGISFQARTQKSTVSTSKGKHGLFSPVKLKAESNNCEMSSPTKVKIKDNKYGIASFLEGFDYLTEDDLDLLANFEEE
jgi:hypothetical protein